MRILNFIIGFVALSLMCVASAVVIPSMLTATLSPTPAVYLIAVAVVALLLFRGVFLPRSNVLARVLVRAFQIDRLEKAPA